MRVMPLAFGAPAFAVTLDGHSSDNAAASTYAYTVVSNIPAGSLAVVFGNIFAAGPTLSSVSDSRGNTWAVNVTASSVPAFASSILGTGLQVGDTVTLTFSGSGTGHAAALMSTNWAQSSPFDKSSTGTGTSAAPNSGATAATTQALEVAFGGVSMSNTNAVTEDASYTQLVEATTAGSRRYHVGYRVLSSTGAQTYAPSTTGSPTWGCTIATYKRAA